MVTHHLKKYVEKLKTNFTNKITELPSVIYLLPTISKIELTTDMFTLMIART